MKFKYIILAAAAVVMLSACDKVSPIGVLVSGTAVEDRVKMSNLYYKQYMEDDKMAVSDDEYTFLVGSDSHLTTDPGRMDEMLKIGLDADDLFYAHLGDIADTKPQYYITLDSLLQEGKLRYLEKHYEMTDEGRYYPKGTDETYALDKSEIVYPFFPVVGNHDITHNGWAMWSNIFHSSFYEFIVFVIIDGKTYYDRHIFLDTASGTLGSTQVDLIEAGALDANNLGMEYRHTFVYGHTNIFRPSSWEFASTFAREETFFLLKQFEKWKADIVFCGHVHKWDERVFDDVTYLTLDSMSERNSPKPGDYLVRVHVKKDGTIEWEKVRMNYVAKK